MIEYLIYGGLGGVSVLTGSYIGLFGISRNTMTELWNEFGGVGALELGRASIEGDQWVREVKSGFLGLGRRTISGHMSTLYDLFVVTRSSMTLTANQLRIYRPAPTNIVLAYQGERAGSRRVVDMAVRPRDTHDGSLDTIS